ncbi:MAG: ABC transporter ATP-binding protein [Negativibacillus sp.]|nr:ABC transporter ATP-binding protein [Negativibacillus sp.]
MNNEKEVLLEVSDLKKHFTMKNKKIIKAVDGVSFSIAKGETLGLVGESGCGKTTCGRTAIGLYAPTSGKTLYRGKEIHSLKGAERKAFTKDVQVVFQDPYSSLDPKMRVIDIVSEGLIGHNLVSGNAEKKEAVQELLKLVGLRSEHATRYVHEFSGGQRQRIGIARALAVSPEFILCDEPISALDVSIQAQIVNLLMRLQKDRGFTYLFIAHDLAMVRHISDKVAVMYLGKIVEMGRTEQLFKSPQHPYTKALLESIPVADPIIEKQRMYQPLKGEATTQRRGAGCVFASRCPYASEQCFQEEPMIHEIEPGYSVACHLFRN